MASKSKVKKKPKVIIIPKKAQLHPLRDVCVQYENNPANAFPRYRPETEHIICHQLKSIMASKSKVKNKVEGHNLQKAHLHPPLRDVCMQYKNNPANALRDISGN